MEREERENVKFSRDSSRTQCDLLLMIYNIDES